MIRLEEIDPRIPRPGWPGRRRAVVRLTVETVLGAVFFIAAIAVICFAVVLVAAATGAATGALP